MEKLKKLSRDILYKIELKTIDGCSEYCLVSANDGDDIYIVLNDVEVETE